MMMFAQEIHKFLTDELEETLRDFVRNAYGERPAYVWLAEDILEEIEELISDELEMCREVYPRFPRQGSQADALDTNREEK